MAENDAMFAVERFACHFFSLFCIFSTSSLIVWRPGEAKEVKWSGKCSSGFRQSDIVIVWPNDRIGDIWAINATPSHT